MKFIILLFFISCSLFAKGQAYFLVGASVDELERKTTISLQNKEYRETSYSLNLTLGQEFESYRYSLNMIKHDHLITFVSLDYLYPSLLEGNTKSFIGLSLGSARFKKLVYEDSKNNSSSSLVAAIQAGFTANEIEFGYRYFFIDKEYTDNIDTEKLKYLHSIYFALKF